MTRIYGSARRPTYHMFHLIMTFCTCGAWLPVWTAIAIYNAMAPRTRVRVTLPMPVPHQPFGQTPVPQGYVSDLRLYSGRMRANIPPYPPSPQDVERGIGQGRAYPEFGRFVSASGWPCRCGRVHGDEYVWCPESRR